MADAAAAIDSGALLLEVIRTAGPVGVIALAAAWWKKAPGPPDRPDVVQLLGEIRDLVRDANHQRAALRESQERIEARLTTIQPVRPLIGPVQAVEQH